MRKGLLTTGLLAALGLYKSNELLFFVSSQFDWVHPVDNALLRATPLVELGRAAAGVRKDGASFEIDPRRLLELVQGGDLMSLVSSGLADVGMARNSDGNTENNDISTKLLPGEQFVTSANFPKIFSAIEKSCARLGVKSCPKFVHAPGAGALRRIQRGGGNCGFYRRNRFIVLPETTTQLISHLRKAEQVAIISSEIAQVILDRSWQQKVFQKVASDASARQKKQISNANSAWVKVANATAELAYEKQVFDDTAWYRRWLAAPKLKNLVDDQQLALREAKSAVSEGTVPLFLGVTANTIFDVAKRAAIFSGDRAGAVAAGSFEIVLSSIVQTELVSDTSMDSREILVEAKTLLELPAPNFAAKVWSGGPLPSVTVRVAVLLQWVESVGGAAFREVCRQADARARRP